MGPSKAAITDINEQQGEATAEQIRASGHDAIFVRLNVTSEEDWANAIQSTVSYFGKLDVLVNNAGTASRETVENTTVEVWDEQMEIHAKGTFLGTKMAVPEMRNVEKGSIVNISSIFGIIGSPSSTAYHAAKGAVRIFTKAAAIQYAHDGIRVNSVHLGYVDPPMTHELFADPDLLKTRTDDKVRQAYFLVHLSRYHANFKFSAISF